MKKPVFVSLLLLLLFSPSAFAQKETGAKLYWNIDYFHINSPSMDSPFGPLQRTSRTGFDRFSIAFDFSSKKRTHEIEIFLPEFNKTFDRVKIPVEHYFWYESDQVTQQVDSYSFRYEFRKQLTNVEKPLSFSLGVAFNPYFVNTDLEPKIANYRAPVDKHLYGGGIALIPQVKYRLNEKVQLDVGFVFKIYEYQYSHLRIRNPTTPERQQKSATQHHTFFENNYTLRFGLYYKLKTVEDDDKSKKRKVHRSKNYKKRR